MAFKKLLSDRIKESNMYKKKLQLIEWKKTNLKVKNQKSMINICIIIWRKRVKNHNWEVQKHIKILNNIKEIKKVLNKKRKIIQKQQDSIKQRKNMFKNQILNINSMNPVNPVKIKKNYHKKIT
jgi:hypothetical protein